MTVLDWLIIKMDQIDGAKLAVLTMFLDCKLAYWQKGGVPMSFMLIMKESGSNLAEQEAA